MRLPGEHDAGFSGTVSGRLLREAGGRLGAAALGTDAMAGGPGGSGSGGTDFADIVTTLTDWSTGTLGKTIALGMFIVGLAAGIVDQSIIAVVVGVSGALALSYGPAVLATIFSAVV